MARRPSKTIVQPDQYELFAKFWARFADIGKIGKLSLTLTSVFLGVVVTSLFSTSEDFWLRPALMKASLFLIAFFISAVLTEFVYAMQWTERKAVFAAFHAVAIVGAVAVVVFLLWQSDVIQEVRAIERVHQAAKIQAAAEAKAEAARAAVAECKKQRTEEIERITKYRANMRTLLQRCRDDYEKSKTIFTEETIDQRCKSRQASFYAAERDLKVANERTCTLAVN